MILVLVGESASGKTTVSKILEEEMGYHRIISHTTRPMRVGEKDGDDYYFVRQDEFNRMLRNDEFAESAAHGSWSYGTSKAELEKYSGDDENCVAILNPVGLREFKKNGIENMFSVYINVDMRERIIKMLQRQDDIQETFRRTNYDAGQFNGIGNEVNMIVDNKNYEKTAMEVAVEIDAAARMRHLWDSKYTPVAK